MLIKDQKKFSTSNAVKSFVNKVIKGKTILIFFSSFKIIINIIIISTISTTVRYTIKNCIIYYVLQIFIKIKIFELKKFLIKFI